MPSFIDLLRKRKRAYQNVFNESSADARRVLADLRSICPEDPTTGANGGADEHKVYINIGKRKVYSHIMSMLNITEEDVLAMSREAIKERLNAGTDEPD